MLLFIRQICAVPVVRISVKIYNIIVILAFWPIPIVCPRVKTYYYSYLVCILFPISLQSACIFPLGTSANTFSVFQPAFSSLWNYLQTTFCCTRMPCKQLAHHKVFASVTSVRGEGPVFREGAAATRRIKSWALVEHWNVLLVL